MIDVSWYRTTVTTLSVVIFFTNFSDYSQRWGIIPLYWIVIIGAMVAPLTLPALSQGRLQAPPLVIWGVCFLLVTIAWFYPSTQDAASSQAVQTRFLSVLVLFMMLFILARPQDQKIARIAIAFAVLLAVALNIYELFYPLTFSTIPGRSSGLYTNVNQSGAALVLGLILAYHVVPSRLRVPFALVTAAGIIPTFSRAAIAGWMLVMLYFAMRSGLGFAQLRRILIMCVLVFGFIVSPYMGKLQQSLENRGTLTLDVIQRLNFLSGNTSDASSQQREQVAIVAWRLFTQHPFAGYGTGQNHQIEGYEVGVHNIYLAMMVDYGILGMFIVPGLMLAMSWGARRKESDVVIPFVMFLSFWGFFSHNVLEERYILVSVALIGSIVASNRIRTAHRLQTPLSTMLPIGAPA